MTVVTTLAGPYFEDLRLGLSFDAPAVTLTEAVSYTHLRAHETVLDLVCRLLLEKKKKNHQYTHHYSLLIKMIIPSEVSKLDE